MSKTILLRLLSLALLALAVGAPGLSHSTALAAETAATAGDTSTMSPQSKFIQNLGSEAISILADKSLTASARDTKFRDMLRRAFDLNTIARFVIGRNWSIASLAQRDEYMQLFENLVVKTYSDRFALYTGEGFRVVSSVSESDKDTIVNSEITHPDGSKSTDVVWRVRTKDGKMGILDVVVEGVSMSVTQRQEYASVLQRNGNDFEGLLQVMRDKLRSVPNDNGAKKS